MHKLSSLLILCLISFVKRIDSLQTELSVLVEAGARECFHQYLVKDLNVETDYQVISGGELEISYWISSPTNRVVFTEVRRQGGQTQFRSEENGEYRFCFDNSFSRFQTKQVFFFLSTNGDYVDPYFPQIKEEDRYQAKKDNLGAELEEKVENMKQAFDRVNRNLENAQRSQNIFRAYELIDRQHLEQSFERVNFWSILNIVVMLTVACIQVFLIRSLFEDKSKIGRVLRGAPNESKRFNS